MACITEIGTKPEGDRSEGSSYPESERAYFKRMYGTDHLKQLHDDHQKNAISRYALETKRRELERRLNRLDNLPCSNDPKMTAPGRSAYSLALLRENLLQYIQPHARSLRWNQHYQRALEIVARDVLALCKGRSLKPVAISEVAESEAVKRNLDKNAGYYAFETGKRSKGENLDSALEWCRDNMDRIMCQGNYGLPLVISHRSSNSKPKGDGTWKWRCRIILMQDVRALLLDGRFAIPFLNVFANIPWGEGSMSHSELENWIQLQRVHYTNFYSTDYSAFDVSQPDWLLEDVFDKIVRPCFGELSVSDQALFDAMKDSYINKEIHSFDGVLKVKGCQLSGALTTYAYNTIINQIIDTTALLVNGLDPSKFKSLKCGDDNLTFYSEGQQPWNAKQHAMVIYKYFGVKTTIGDKDMGRTDEMDPTFLSRTWTWNGAERDIDEVLWNLVYPERFRNYDPRYTHVEETRAVALVLACAVLEQPATMRKYFNVNKILSDAKTQRGDFNQTYKAVEALGSGFRTPWLNFKFGSLKQNFVA